MISVDVEMVDFRVVYQVFREINGGGGSFELVVVVFVVGKVVYLRGVGVGDGIVIFG